MEISGLTILLFYFQVDKASVLGDAIKYLKQLQERVKTLEEQAEKEIHRISCVGEEI